MVTDGLATVLTFITTKQTIQIVGFAVICITGGSIGGGTLLDDDTSEQTVEQVEDLQDQIDELRRDLETHIRSKEKPGDRWRHRYGMGIGARYEDQQVKSLGSQLNE